MSASHGCESFAVSRGYVESYLHPSRLRVETEALHGVSSLVSSVIPLDNASGFRSVMFTESRC